MSTDERRPPAPYEEGGYANAKRRTRSALLDAARHLLAAGETPTVEAAARRAAVSRTTAYRYFPNRSALLVAAHPEVSATSLLGEEPPDAVEERLDTVVRSFLDLVIDTEPQLRTMLRLSLEVDPGERGELPLRQGRAIGWITEALEPLRSELTSEQVARLAIAIRSAVGIESLVWLTDVAGLSRARATELMRWSARAMLAAATASGPER